MIRNIEHIGLAKLCGWFGITRQAYYQNEWRTIKTNVEEELLIKEVKKIRVKHPRMGTRKLYEVLRPFIQTHQIKIGRDGLFDLLAANDMLVRKNKRSVYTTQSYHWLRKYPNLIKDWVPTGRNQLWVSDITYWKIESGYVYISMITDGYSHKIVGYHVAETLESIYTIRALRIAISGLMKEPKSHIQLIHHSDRGIQYCSHKYVRLLNSHNIAISMTEDGNPLDNAIAERVNGIIKEEYLQGKTVKNITQAKSILKKAIWLYNEQRPHSSISNRVPSLVHKDNLRTERLWKAYYKKHCPYEHQSPV